MLFSHYLLYPFVMLTGIIPVLEISRKKLVVIDHLQARLFSRQGRNRKKREGKMDGAGLPLSCFNFDIEQSRIHHHCTSGANSCCHRGSRTVGVVSVTLPGGTIPHHRNGACILNSQPKL